MNTSLHSFTLSRRDLLFASLAGATIFPYRNANQTQWQAAVRDLQARKAGLVWFLCNDDHIFIDYELDLLLRLVERLEGLAAKHPLVSLYFSHWAGNICFPNRIY